MCYIFEKVMVRGPQKQCSRVSDMQIHKYNYTNTQIQFGSNLHIGLTCAIFLKRWSYEDLKNNVPKYLMCKYTNTVLVKVTDMPNICYIFGKVMVWGPQKQCSWVSDVQIHKYINTASVKVTDRPIQSVFFQTVLFRTLFLQSWPGIFEVSGVYCLLAVTPVS